MKRLFLQLTLLFVSSLVLAQPMDRIDKGLAERLESLTDSDFINVIIVMADQVDVNGMAQTFKQARASKAERHYAVVTALQHKAAQTQSAMLTHFNARKIEGTVRHMEPMWIMNMFVGEATKREILDLAKRPDVGRIYFDGPLLLDEPFDYSPASPSPGAAEPGLRAMNAHKLWELGYTGEGTIVMNIDTGVNGTHPALMGKWRGNQPGVLPGHAWFDLKTPPSATPVDYGSTKHGSHTMGIMMGLDPATADTIGVAFGAQWIASPTIDVGFSPHTSYTLKAFQWALDPDSNVNTSNDVPDVISNSYQDPNVSSTECSGASGYWTIIDALEAVGTAVVWSAGNSGSAASTITPPKNRISTDVNFFAVGNLNTSTAPPWTISSSSSRGPSKCDNVTIKPEVCAPGTSIRSALAGTSYGNLSGTSMASPHVAGAIALLKSANPNLTGTDAKLALYNTAVDYGTPGEDNTYGKGFIDVFAAFMTISLANPRIQGFVTEAGTNDTLSGVVVTNLNTGGVVQTQSNGFYRFVLADTGIYRIRFSKLGYGTRIDTVHAPQDSTTYQRNVSLTKLPAPAVAANPASLPFNLAAGDSATALMTVSNNGPATSQLAYTISLTGGVGGLLQNTIGTNSSQFTNGNFFRGNRYFANQRTTLKEIKSYHIISGSTEFRFSVYENSAPTGTFTKIFESSPVTHSGSANFYGSGPITVQLDSGKYYAIGAAWQGTTHNYYSSTSSTTPVGFGQALSGVAITGYPPPATASITSTTTSFYYGAVVTTSGTFISLTPTAGDTLVGATGKQHTVKVISQYLDPLGGPYSGNLVIASNDPATPTLNVPVALTLTPTSVGGGTPEGIPGDYALHQNYPNPFNPNTSIRFDIATQGHVTLKIYDVLGRLVRTLVNDVRPAGFYNEVFDARSFASGMYYYTLSVNGFNSTKKMVLLK